MDLNSGTYDDIKVIHRASELGNIEMVKYLMKKGASLQPVNRFGENTLSLAIKNRYLNGDVRVVMWFFSQMLYWDHSNSRPLKRVSLRKANTFFTKASL